MSEYRSGIGVDAHAFAAGRRLVLGGVEIEHTQGLAGHSDADVLIHAIVDALLGAAGMGDIGRHFPDSDTQYKDASSLLLLGEARNKLAADRWSVANVDATVVVQEPRLTAYIDAMKSKISDTLGVSSTRINIKATTTEKLGFTGREEGIAAVAVATVYK
jgi:2-C-methyl-D-erythritol 2,4-cyclodiphosphate synthase